MKLNQIVMWLAALSGVSSFALIPANVNAVDDNNGVDLSDSKERGSSVGVSDNVRVFTLEKALEYALAHNFELARSKERISKQHHVLIEARSGFYPTIGANGNYTRTDTNRLQKFNGQTFGSTTSWIADLTVAYEIYSGGVDSANSTRASILKEAAKLDFKTALQDVMSEVRTRIYDVLLAQKQIEVQEQATKLLGEDLESERSKLKAGTVSDFNVLRAEVALANSRTPLIRSKNELTLAKEELRRVLGMSGDNKDPENVADFSVEASMDFVPINYTLEDSLRTANKERTDIARAEKQVAAEGQGIEIAKAGWLPQISIVSTYGAEKSRFTDEVDENVNGWTAGVNGSWNFFDGFRTSSRIAQAQAEESIARITLAEIRQRINVEINRTYSSFLEAKELVSVSAKVTSQAEESLRLARARLNAGAGVQLDVLDTQVALTEARTNHIRALHDYIVAVTKLKRAMGVLDQVN